MEQSHAENAHQTTAHDSSAVDSALDATQESLEKVRDILFGAQVRQQDHRYHELEEKLAREQADFREESRKRLDSLEAFAKKEIAAVIDLLKAETCHRTDAITALTTQLKETAAGIERRICGVDEQHSATERGVREELLQQSKSLRDELLAQAAAINGVLEKTTGELKHGKTDRAALAGLFTEMAQRINA